MSDQPRIYIAYGICEGPKIGARFETALRQAGYAIVRKITQAEIIMTHSGGCFVLPAASANRPIIIMGLPFLPHGHLGIPFLQNIWRGFQNETTHESLFRWLEMTAWNAIYAFNLPHGWRMLRGMRAGTWRSFQPVLLIRNEHDPLSTPDFASIPFSNTPLTAQLPGGHGDCWDNPGPYVTLIKRVI